MSDQQEAEESTMTKGQYDQIRFDVQLDGSFAVLSDEERADLEAEINGLNLEAAHAALYNLVLRHPVEFHDLLREQREARNLNHQLRSTFSDLLAIAERNALTF